MSGGGPKRVRCAIYTRKSSEEGLEQDFNSLHAQREACGAYILSQASEGWTALPDVYDDGGLSGGTLERPALQRLLADVFAGRVDIIVVYKVDRLTRSLLDFSKLVEAFDKAGTSFVSVTQSFNTTTSMGRLTLNMLLSFAQFEREVTAERIRDKLAASKARGMWMGGTPPLGYAPDGRTLAIVDEHAAIVRRIYERYLALGAVRLLADELARDRIGNPVRERRDGGRFGGTPLGRGQIYGILRNPVYAGRIRHRTKTHAGLHDAIITPATWNAVQAMLAEHRTGERVKVRGASPSLLAGRVVDAEGDPLISTHANKAGRRYRYYVSRALHDADTSQGMRVPALELETAVAQRLAEAFDDPFALAGAASLSIVASGAAGLVTGAGVVAAKLRHRDRATLQALVGRVQLRSGAIEIGCSTSAVAGLLGLETAPDGPATVELTAPVTLARTGRAMRLVHEGGAAATGAANPSLGRMLAKARRWWKLLREGEIDVTALAAQEGVQPSWVTRVVRLAFLSPQVVDAVLKGRLRAEVDVTALLATGGVPTCWREQARTLLPTGAAGQVAGTSMAL